MRARCSREPALRRKLALAGIRFRRRNWRGTGNGFDGGEMMGKKVWIVTTGEYSDYGISAVCSTEDKANQAAGMFRDANTPFEMEIDAHVPKAKRGLKLFLCWVNKYDTDISPSQFDPTFGDNTDVETKNGESLRLWVWAKDTQHAAKIANEKRSRWVAGVDTYPRS
jgi:hypothetical protein